MRDCDFAELVGKTLADCRNENDEKIVFELAEGGEYTLFHAQDCCESVTVEDIAGDLADLVGTPILQAEEVSYSGDDSCSDEWP